MNFRCLLGLAAERSHVTYCNPTLTVDNEQTLRVFQHCLKQIVSLLYFVNNCVLVPISYVRSMETAFLLVAKCQAAMETRNENNQEIR